MYMSVEDQYFWEFILVIPMVVMFLVCYIKHYIDEKLNEQYQLGYEQGRDDCIEELELYCAIEE